MKTYLILNCVIAFVGAFLFLHLWQASKKEELSDFLLPKEEVMRCKNKKGFIKMVYPKAMIFALVMVLIGVVGAFVELKMLTIPYWRYIELSLFLVFLAIFWQGFLKGKNQFF